jgi:c-di-GMP-binding flagellar brake protein YcgR
MRIVDTKIGTKLELQQYDVNGNPAPPMLISQFEGINEDGTLVVLVPIFEGSLYPLHADTIIQVAFELKSELYAFDAKVIQRYKEGNIYYLQMRAVSDITQIQRRNFFRFDCVMDIEYRIFHRDVEDEKEKGPFSNAISRDISGGGLCLMFETAPGMGMYIEGFISKINRLPFAGKIVRVILTEGTGINRFEIGVEFLNIENRNREKIIAFIFESQRNLIKKGLGK